MELSNALGHSIYYTLDGSIPGQNSFLYDQPLNMSNLTVAEPDISNISTSYAWSAPTGEVHQINVVSARAFLNGSPSSRVYSKTYMIGGEVKDLYHDFPIISLQTDSLNLFDYDTGIYVSGVHFDSNNHEQTGNFFQKGIDWERVGNIAYFEDGNLS